MLTGVPELLFWLKETKPPITPIGINQNPGLSSPLPTSKTKTKSIPMAIKRGQINLNIGLTISTKGKKETLMLGTPGRARTADLRVRSATLYPTELRVHKLLYQFNTLALQYVPMVQIRNIGEAEQVLAGYIPQVRELLGKDLTLIRIKPLLAKLGNPESKLKIIHVAGTSGKTSTSYYIASLLKTAGKKVGLTVSPHLDSVTERVQINLEPLPEGVFCQALGEFMDLVQDVDPQPTYFELMIVFVYWYFAKVGVDYAVIETGLGGTFDATNVAGNNDKVCVITDIGLDHTHVLGNTLPEIAGQKAGIIYPKNHVFMYEQSPAVMEVFQSKVKDEQAILNMLSNFDELSRGVKAPAFRALPEYQQRNWLLAEKVYKYLAERDSLPALNDDKLETSMDVQVPGRMDVQQVGGKTIVMDGAHNEQKMTAFVSSFKKLYPNQKAAILLSLKEGKEYEAVLPLLKPICTSLILTTFLTTQDLPATSIHPGVLEKAAHARGFEDVTVEPSHKAAYQQLLAKQDSLVIITGSFYLLSTLRPFILKRND